MRRSTRKCLAIGATFVLFLIVLVLTVGRIEPATMAGLRFDSYVTNNSGVKSAVLVLTNPGPARVDYSAHYERSGTNTFIANGTVSVRSPITFQIPLSEQPTRLLVNCATRNSFRDLAEDVSNFIGVTNRTRSSEYTLFSDALTK